MDGTGFGMHATAAAGPSAADCDADVVVVGAGPVGTLLAVLLGQRGHRVTIVERWPLPYDQPRAVTYDHEIARILSMLGVDSDDDPAIGYHEELYYWKNAAGDPLNISIRGLPKSQQELVDATREEKYQEAVYAMLGKQLEAARLDEAHEAPIVQVVEAAIPADRKTSPRRSMIVAAFLMAGLFLSSFVIFTRFLVEHASPSRRQTFSNLKKALSSW